MFIISSFRHKCQLFLFFYEREIADSHWNIFLVKNYFLFASWSGKHNSNIFSRFKNGLSLSQKIGTVGTCGFRNWLTDILDMQIIFVNIIRYAWGAINDINNTVVYTKLYRSVIFLILNRYIQTYIYINRMHLYVVLDSVIRRIP